MTRVLELVILWLAITSPSAMIRGIFSHCGSYVAHDGCKIDQKRLSFPGVVALTSWRIFFRSLERIGTKWSNI
jgi:hypothetical protein